MMKKLLLLAVLGIVIVTGVFLIGHWGAAESRTVTVSGNIEVTETAVSFKIPGRVINRPADEGQLLKAGQLVASLDDSDLKDEVGRREAELEAAKAALSELEAGSRSEEIGQARAAVEAAEAEAARQNTDEKRQADLLKKDIISQREYDASRAAMETSAARLSEARERYLLVKNGPRPQTIAQAKARVEAAQQVLELAQSQLGYATLTAPAAGVVLSKAIEPGEIVAPGTPVITLGDMKSVWMRAYIDETDLGKIKVNQRAWITTDTYPAKRYQGTVVFISPEAEFTPKSVQTKKERVKLVYRIKIDVPNPSTELKPGMPADASIEVGP